VGFLGLPFGLVLIVFFLWFRITWKFRGYNLEWWGV